MIRKKSDSPAGATKYEYLVVDEDLSEEFGIIYLGTEEEKARDLAFRWQDRPSVKLKRRQVTEFELYGPSVLVSKGNK